MTSKTELQNLYYEAFNLYKQGNFDIDLFVKKHQLTNYGRESIVIMLARREYIPDLENFYKRTAEIFIDHERPVDEYQAYCFLEEVPPHSKGAFDLVLKDDETIKAYEKLGLVERTTISEYNRSILELYLALNAHVKQHDLDIKEALAHNDADFFKDYLRNETKEKILIALKRDKLSPEEIKKVLKFVGLEA